MKIGYGNSLLKIKYIQVKKQSLNLQDGILKNFYRSKDKSKKLFEIWYFMLKFIAPIAIVVIMINQIWG